MNAQDSSDFSPGGFYKASIEVIFHNAVSSRCIKKSAF